MITLVLSTFWCSWGVIYHNSDYGCTSHMLVCSWIFMCWCRNNKNRHRYMCLHGVNDFNLQYMEPWPASIKAPFQDMHKGQLQLIHSAWTWSERWQHEGFKMHMLGWQVIFRQLWQQINQFGRPKNARERSICFLRCGNGAFFLLHPTVKLKWTASLMSRAIWFAICFVFALASLPRMKHKGIKWPTNEWKQLVWSG